MITESPAKSGGVYGDFSNPNSAYYYVKCPKCGLVHGDFKNMREAHAKKLCSNCNIEVVNKIKDEVKDVIDDPSHKPKKMSKIVGEAIDDPLNELPDPGNDQDDPEDSIDLKDEMFSLLFGNWVDVALRCISKHLDVDRDDIMIDERASNRIGIYYDDDKENSTVISMEVSGEEWLIFKNEDTAEAYALERVTDDLVNQPEIFAKDWLKDFIDTDKLTDAIGSTNEGWDDEIRGLDYDELLDRLVHEGQIRSDDSMFFDDDGSPKIPTPVSTALLNDIMEAYLDANEPDEPDPWEYLEDTYGADNAVKEALNLVRIDVDEAAADAISQDGWPHFIATYDGEYQTAENGAVYFRTG